MLSGCSSIERITIPFVGKSIVENVPANYALFGYIFGVRSFEGGEPIKQYYSSDAYKLYYIPRSLSEVNILSGDIRDGAFNNCSNLTKLTLPSNVKNIGKNAFKGCLSLKEVYYNSDIAGWCGIKFSNEASNPLGRETTLFINNEIITNVEIPNSVTKIGDYAFYFFNSLTSITIPDIVTSIGSSAFQNCRKLTSITIPSSVKTIGYNAFYACERITEVYNFSNISLNSLNNSNITEYAKIIHTRNEPSNFVASNGVLYFINESEKIAIAPIDYDVTSLVIDDDCTEINRYAFFECHDLKNLIIPNSVNIIGELAFAHCDSLSYNEDENAKYLGNSQNPNLVLIEVTNKDITSFKVKDNTKIIYFRAFFDCKNINSIIISESVNSIGEDAFSYCKNLTSITIPKSVYYIGKYAFYNCTALSEVIFDNPKNWLAMRSGEYSQAIGLSSSDVSNSTLVAEYLTTNYNYFSWRRVG